MLRHQTPQHSNPIVRLFPRLAPAVVATKIRIERKRPQGGVATISNANPYQDERTQVQARLLRMILDNERSRRHDRRPDVS
jgi:hypothetical protein